MRIILFCILLFQVILSNSQDSKLSFMSFNIRYDNPQDGEFSWKFRKPLVLETIDSLSPDVLGIQEGLDNQVTELDQYLSDYKRYGVGRIDGKKKGEYTAIYYKDSLFKFIEGGEFWLSEEPEKPGSIGWDAACERMVTWVKLVINENEDTLVVLNTHFDHVGDTAQLQSTEMVIDFLNRIGDGYLFILMGDMNFTKDSEAYKRFRTKEVWDSNLDFVKKSGPEYTYIGFPSNGSKGKTIDYIFFRSVLNNGFVYLPHKYSVIDHNNRGYYPSDHLPVFIEMQKGEIPEVPE